LNSQAVGVIPINLVQIDSVKFLEGENLPVAQGKNRDSWPITIGAMMPLFKESSSSEDGRASLTAYADTLFLQFKIASMFFSAQSSTLCSFSTYRISLSERCLLTLNASTVFSAAFFALIGST